MKELKSIRDLTKAGFIRREDLDFRDDGNYFKMFEYNTIIVSYLKQDGMYYICAGLHNMENNPLDYFEYSSIENYFELEDEFNGCEEVDIDKLIENINTLKIRFDEKVKEVESKSIDVKVLQDKFDKESKELDELLTNLKTCDWLSNEISEYDLSRIRRYAASLQNDRRCRQDMLNSNDKRILRRLLHNNYIFLDKDGYYFQEIQEFIEKYN